MLTIGLTGGIATGKSTVAALLNERPHIACLDADSIAREVVEPGSEALAQIQAAFGPQYLGPDGHLDREALGKRVVSDAHARSRLEAITHPQIRSRILTALVDLADRGLKAAVVEAALLVETGSHRAYDQLWVVSCAPEIQLQRLVSRKGCSEEEARAWIDAQLPLEEKAAMAQVVIENNGSLEDLCALVDIAVQGLDFSE